MKKTVLYTLLGLFSLATLTGCKNTQTMTTDPTISLAYLMNSSTESLNNLSKAYGTTINRTRKSKYKQPGLCSDYAVTLALLGNHAEANKWFNKEVADFPSSRPYVLQLKKQLIPELMNDNTQASDDDIVVEEAPVETSKAAGIQNDAIKNVIDEANAREQGDEDQLKRKKSAKSDDKATKEKKSKKGKKSKKSKPSKKAPKND